MAIPRPGTAHFFLYLDPPNFIIARAIGGYWLGVPHAAISRHLPEPMLQPIKAVELEEFAMVTNVCGKGFLVAWILGSCLAEVAKSEQPIELERQLLPQPPLLIQTQSSDGVVESSRRPYVLPDTLSGTFSGGSDVCSDAIVTPVIVGPAGSPSTVTITGDNSTVTDNDCASPSNVWWEAFQLQECATVTLDFCGTTPARPADFSIFSSDCACSNFVFADLANRTDCGDTNLTAHFAGLPAGTYFLPIFSSQPGTKGPYTIHITAEASNACIGACCDQASSTCTGGVDSASCNGPGQTFLNQGTCCEVECRPATPEFDASNVSLLGHVALTDFVTAPTEANEVWGYVSPSGREYAIIGLECSVGFVEVTDPSNPVVVAEIPGPCSIWRDMAIFQQRAYAVIDSTGNGLLVMNLSNIDSGVVTLEARTKPGNLLTAHNIAINEASGFAYAVSTNINPGMVVLDLSVPTNPPIAGQWSNANVHDVLVVSYTSGPFAGREIAFASAIDSGLKIVDVTDKANMFTRSTVLYPNTSIAHQAWLSEDRRFLFLGDEGDETGGLVANTTTYVIDVQDLDAASLVTSFTNGLCTIDHNMMVRGPRLFQANYTSGLRIFDITDVNAVTEIGYFDTHPESNATSFDGAWGVYSALPSGVVLLSDIQRGLFVLDVSATDFGACCDMNTGNCTDNTQAADCTAAMQTWTANQTCANINCPPTIVPTTSQWGLLALTLTLLVSGTLVLRKRKPAAV